MPMPDVRARSAKQLVFIYGDVAFMRHVGYADRHQTHALPDRIYTIVAMFAEMRKTRRRYNHIDKL